MTDEQSSIVLLGIQVRALMAAVAVMASYSDPTVARIAAQAVRQTATEPIAQPIANLIGSMIEQGIEVDQREH